MVGPQGTTASKTASHQTHASTEPVNTVRVEMAGESVGMPKNRTRPVNH